VQTTPSNSTTVLTTIWIRLRNVSGRSIPRRSTSSVPKSTSHPDSCSLWNSTERRSFVDHYESGDLTYEFGPDEQYERGTDDDSQARPADAESVADGGTVGDLSTDHIIEFGDTALELAPPDAIPEDQPLTTLAKPTVTSDGTILARPATETVSPLGVRWQGSATRKQDWMTSLSPFTADDDEAELSAVDQPGGALASLVDHLMEATAPVAFQVVFQRRESWQADADLRKEDVIDGRDTLPRRLLAPSSNSTANRRTGTKTSLATRLQNASRQSSEKSEAVVHREHPSNRDSIRGRRSR